MVGVTLKRDKVISLARDWRGSSGVRSVAGPALKRIDVEAFLRWVYREELPKAAPAPLAPGEMRGGWDAVAEWSKDLCLKVDDGAPVNRFGVVPLGSSEVGPHTDALRAHEAVGALDDLSLSIPDDWEPFGDFGDLGEAGAQAAREALARMSDTCQLRKLPRLLVMRHALIGGCPDWESEAPVRDVVRSSTGQPRWYVRRTMLMPTVSGAEVATEIEVDGWCARKRRPIDGSYQKTILRPDPAPVAVERAEYEVWRVALDVIAADLEGALDQHEVTASQRPARPWEGEENAIAVRRVLPDLSQRASPAATSRRPPSK